MPTKMESLLRLMTMCLNYNILVVDDKKNPFYGLPTYLIDFTDMLALTKNNINAASLESEGYFYPSFCDLRIRRE